MSGNNNVLANIVKTNKEIQEIPKEVIDLLKRTVAKGATDLELQLFLHTASAYNLDPLLREIWFYKIEGQVVMYPSRDGFLKAAKRDPAYKGLISFVVRDGDLFEVDSTKLTVTHKFGSKRGNIIGAWAMAKHKYRPPIITFASMKDYYKPNKVWKTYPEAMIQKVAEAHALRKQFGLSGLYDEAEFGGMGESPIYINSDANQVDIESSDEEWDTEVINKECDIDIKEDVVVEGEFKPKEDVKEPETPEKAPLPTTELNNEDTDLEPPTKTQDTDETVPETVKKVVQTLASQGKELNDVDCLEIAREMLRESKLTVSEFKEVRTYFEDRGNI